jgi:endonuclease/exonuclease/phosphatase family metal-dependent hydrolase
MSSAAATTFTALTLNMQSGQIWDPAHPDDAPFDPERTINFLRSQDCDIMFLQEVEFPETGAPDTSLHPNFDRLKAGLPGWDSTFAWPAATRPHLPFGVGLAIFSRFPLSDSFHVVLPASDQRFEFRGQSWLPAERSLIGATVRIDGKELTLLNTHLQAYFMIDSSADEHPEQRRVLTTVIRGRRAPVLLGGDFNCTEQEGTIGEIEATGLRSVQKRQITWHRQPLVLDHLFYSPELRPASPEIVRTDVSDHDAVRASFQLA